MMNQPTGPEQPPTPGGNWRKRSDPNQIGQADIQFAADHLLQGETPETVRGSLIEQRGLSPDAADNVLIGLLLNQAPQPSSAKRIVCKLLGGAIFVVGVGLFIGNVTGVFPSFPLAGFIVMGVGGAIWGAGESS
jgi:hypothetical protein